MIDADEIARWRDRLAREPGCVFLAKSVLALLDALAAKGAEIAKLREALKYGKVWTEEYRETCVLEGGLEAEIERVDFGLSVINAALEMSGGVK